MDKMLKVEDLIIQIDDRKIIDHLSFSVKKGEILGIAGESGSGKSSLARAIMGLLPHKEGRVLYGSNDLHKQIDLIGRELTLVPQNSMNSFNPSMKMGEQLIDGLLLHSIMEKAEGKKTALDYMERLGLSSDIYDRYPHELSGGMKQRMAFIMGILPKPGILILDEVTTGLDKVSKKKLIDLIVASAKERAVILISHEIDLIRDITSRVIVLKNGLPVEWGASEQVLTNPQHPYVKALVGSLIESLPEDITPIEKIRSFNSRQRCPFVEYCTEAMRVCTLKDVYRKEDAASGVSCWKFFPGRTI